jgi:uncharacterized membrane protein
VTFSGPAQPSDHEADQPDAASPTSPSGSGQGAEDTGRSKEVAAVATLAGPAAPVAHVAADEDDRSASLSPSERVIPTWTDPTVRRASEVIGGPLGRHAIVGRAPILTPLRVCLLMAICVLIGGWLFKSACIQTGSDGQLDQSGQRPWITGCYNDVVPLYGGRGLDDPRRNPYSYSWAERPNGNTSRIWPSDQVTVTNGQVIGSEHGTQTVLPDDTLVGSPETGFSEVQGGALVPINASQVGTVRYLEYPVITGYWLWGVAWLTHAYMTFAKSTHIVPVPLDVAAFFTIGAILLGLMYLWVVACTAKIARRRIWDTAVMCLSPLLIVHAFTNWDLIAIGFTGGAMLAWARKRSLLAGVLFGLGAAAKLYPAFLLGPLLILCLRSGKLGPWFKAFFAAAITWVAVNLPIYLAYPDAWGEFYRMNTSRGAEWDSWYFLFSTLTNTNVFGGNPPTLLNALSLLLFALACVAIGWFALSCRRRPRFAQLAFLVVAAFLLTNKVWSPQYSLWLVPLAALAIPRWRWVLAWQFAEAIVWMLLMLSFDSDTGRNLSIYPFVGAALIRDALLIALVVLIIRDCLHPEIDLVRQGGDDDPAGGVFDGVPDRFTVPSVPGLFSRWWRRRSAASVDDDSEVGSPVGSEIGPGPAEPDSVPHADPDGAPATAGVS